MVVDSEADSACKERLSGAASAIHLTSDQLRYEWHDCFTFYMLFIHSHSRVKLLRQGNALLLRTVNSNMIQVLCYNPSQINQRSLQPLSFISQVIIIIFLFLECSVFQTNTE